MLERYSASKNVIYFYHKMAMVLGVKEAARDSKENKGNIKGILGGQGGQLGGPGGWF